MSNSKNCSFSQFYPASCRFFLVVAFVIVSTNSHKALAQSTPSAYEMRWYDSTTLVNRKINIIKTNILSYLIGMYNISYEHLSKSAPRSFVAKLDVYNYNLTELKLQGVNLKAGIRYYLTKKRQPPAGFYVQPFLTYGEYTVYDKKLLVGAHVGEIGGGIIGGLQWAIGGRITIEIFLGGAYANLTASSNTVRGAVKSFQPILGATTGFRF